MRPDLSDLRRERDGGADRDRTDDLLIPNEALSQLSYGPTRPVERRAIMRLASPTVKRRIYPALQGLGRFVYGFPLAA